VARGAGAGLFALIGAMALLHFARRATGAEFGYLEQRFLLAQVTRWEIAVLLLGAGFALTAAAELARGRRLIALLPLAAGLASSLFGGFDPWGLGLGVVAAVIALVAYGRPVSRPAAWAGVLILTLVAALAAQVFAAPTAFVFAWPLLIGAVGAAATDLSLRRSNLALVLLAALAAVAMGWLGGFAHQSFISLDLVELTAISLLGAAAVAWPLAQPTEGAPPERLLGPALLIIGLAVTVAVRVNTPYDARFPAVSYVVYQEDQDAGRAWIVSASPEARAWSQAAMAVGGGKPARFVNWVWRRPVEAAPAPYQVEPKTAVELTPQPDGTLRLVAVPPPGARMIGLSLKPDTPVTVQSVQGVPIRMVIGPGAQAQVGWAAPGQGLTLVLKPAGPGKMLVRYNSHLERWPPGAPPLPKRPADVMPFNDSDATYLTGARELAW